MQNQPLILEKPVAKPTRLFYVTDFTPSHEIVYEIDGYCIKDGKTGRDLWTLHIVCPNCRKNLTIECTKKALEIPSESLAVECFRCTHPAEFGGICSFQEAIEPPKGNQKTTYDEHGRRIRVDGVYRRA